MKENNDVNKFRINPIKSEGIQTLENEKNIIDINIEDLLKKIDIKYDTLNDCIIINTDINLMINSKNNIFISKEDTIILTGDQLGTSNGCLYLNPEISLTRKIRNYFKF